VLHGAKEVLFIINVNYELLSLTINYTGLYNKYKKYRMQMEYI